MRRLILKRGLVLAWAVATGFIVVAPDGPGSRLFAGKPDPAPQPALTRFEFEQVRFAAPVRLVVYAPSEAVANKVSSSVFDRLKHLDRIMSDYDPDSELSKLCASSAPGRPIRVSEELFAVLKESQRLAEATGGAFDISVAPVVKLWRVARRNRELPTDDRLTQAMALVGARFVQLNEPDRTIELQKPGMQLDLGGIAQGYAADDAMRILNEAGITRALVDVSGDIRVGEAPPGRDGWRIEIEALKSAAATTELPFVTLTNAAISTAGDAYQFTEIDGVRYSHIIDARTGRPMTQSCSVTVIAKDALTADGLDTALCVLDDEAGRTLVKSVPNVRVIITRQIDGKEVTHQWASDP